MTRCFRLQKTRIAQNDGKQKSATLISLILYQRSHQCIAVKPPISESMLERVLRYFFNADSNVSLLKEQIRKIQSKPLQTTTMTLAEQLLENAIRSASVEVFAQEL